MSTVKVYAYPEVKFVKGSSRDGNVDVLMPIGLVTTGHKFAIRSKAGRDIGLIAGDVVQTWPSGFSRVTCRWADPKPAAKVAGKPAAKGAKPRTLPTLGEAAAEIDAAKGNGQSAEIATLTAQIASLTALVASLVKPAAVEVEAHGQPRATATTRKPRAPKVAK